jgi:hypothetical protein
MTVVVNGHLLPLFNAEMRISFWALDGVCGLLPAANSNARLKVLDA